MDELGSQIRRIRGEWGSALVILGHHYQNASVLRHADETGDSLELSRKAASRRSAERIVFCGVRFMAESADVLTSPDKTVYMPVTSAGCPMANMADASSFDLAWSALERAGGGWLPVVYVNSSAELKARCGVRGGSTCTSSNAGRVFQWVFGQGKRVFFLPDEHLGVNTAADLEVPDSEVAVYDPRLANGGCSDAVLRSVRVLVWKGFCLVHTAFTPAQVAEARARLPGCKVIVHPESPRSVVRLADAHGSTSQIIRYVEGLPAGSTVVIGTELNLVERLAEVHRGRVTVKALAPSVCANMARTREANLLELLRDWPAGQEIHVPSDVAQDARVALERMLRL